MCRRFAGGSRGIVAAIASCIAGSGMLGCAPIAPGGGDLGVTPGGQQDIAQARQVIERGDVPDPNLITVEGFLSEHDIPIAAPEDAPEIFASVGVAYRQPFNEPAPMADVFVGLGTTLNAADFERPPLNLVLAIDRSGSMNFTWDDPYGNYYSYGPPAFYDPLSWFFSMLFAPPPPPPPAENTKMATVRAALLQLADKLGPDDILTIITFNETSTVDLPSTAVTDRAAVRRALDNIVVGGSTNIYAALERSFELATAQKTSRRLNRVILFTDAQPNVGPEGSPEFVNLVRRYANQDIGLTLMGVGLDFGAALGKSISELRGGNSFYMSSDARGRELFGDEFEYFVTPAAYDLRLSVSVIDGVGIREVYGVNGYTPGLNTADLRVPTLFFSPRGAGGTIIVRLSSAHTPDLEEDVNFGRMSLSYQLTDGTTRSQMLDLILPAGTAPDANPPFYSQEPLRRSAVLLDTVVTLKKAAQMMRSNNYDGARQMIDAFLVYFDQATLGLSNRISTDSRSLGDERLLLEDLRGNYYYGY